MGLTTHLFLAPRLKTYIDLYIYQPRDAKVKISLYWLPEVEAPRIFRLSAHEDVPPLPLREYHW
jgi:hypothetical protein